MIVSLVLKGELDEIRRFVDLIERSGISETNVRPAEKLDVGAFVRELSRVGRSTVANLAAIQAAGHSSIPVKDRTITREVWRMQGNTESKEEFNGVLGSIGRAWAKVSDEPNPFASLGRDPRTDDHIHGIEDPELASSLIELLIQLN